MNVTPHARFGLPLALIAALSLILAACSSAGASAPPGSPSSVPSQAPTEQPAPSDPDASVTSPPDPSLGSGGIGDGKLVMPRPGTINPHPVAVEKIEPAIDGRHVTVKLTWTSGVEPCYQLDSVVVSRDGNDIALTVVEGSGQQDVMCVEIAQQKSTIVDLGELEPGEYTISATDSQIPPVTITVS